MSLFGINIKKIRQVKGLSQKAFADLFALNRGVISSYEEGRAEPKIETILKVANHFNLSLDKLLTEPVHANQLAGTLGASQPLLFPASTGETNLEIQKTQSVNNANSAILQKILASVDLVYEFSPEKTLLPQYQSGDILFLNKTNLAADSISNLVVHINGNLQYATDNQLKNKNDQEYFKIVGYFSTGNKNIFTGIFERLERLEKKTGNSQIL
ncbi:helix-turn-helix domain-containing protein [Chryseobacterium cucumeris]|uniref:helix-turn-helix domain-containing protein n=1 Tax=Chryseobacterium cucumeris TaxID=1813611 RepID=UPI00192D85FC|nr:helix-turn-helix transcriptional regulator [Chryseobacterium cucumeris]QRA44197.1 helix-turn-helix transcriptional regulator [Chryseobacterium cucumeris]